MIHNITRLGSDKDLGHTLDPEHIWSTYHHRVIGLARKLIRGNFRIGDEEDIAQCVFQSFFSAYASRKLVTMRGSADIWRVLASMTKRSVVNHYRYENRRRRKPADAKLGTVSPSEVMCRRPGPAESFGGREVVETLLGCLKNDIQRDLAISKMDGYTNAEVGVALQVHISYG